MGDARPTSSRKRANTTVADFYIGTNVNAEYDITGILQYVSVVRIDW